jgi:hypothetical protein
MGSVTPTSPENDEVQKRRLWIVWIMIAVILWGAFLAVGAWLSSHDWRRPAIVMGCVFAFLAFWGAMLAARGRG